jgi:opacity protein-like surface antigen
MDAHNRIPSDLALIEVWSAGAGLRYALRQNLALTLDYQFNNSNTKYRTPLAFAASTQIRQNVISVGLTYRY